MGDQAKQVAILEQTEQIALRRQRVRELDSGDTGPVRMGNCRWSHEDMDKMERMRGSAFFKPEKVLAMRQKAVEQPQALPAADSDALLTVPPESAPAKPFPDWAATVCAHRSEFANCIPLLLGQGAGAGAEAYLFLYAKQNPRVVTLALLEEIEYSNGGLAGAASSSSDRYGKMSFRLTGEFFAEGDLQVGDGDTLLVLTHVKSGDGQLLFSYKDPVPMVDFVAGLPPLAARGRGEAVEGDGSGQRKKARFSDDLVKQYPWLKHYQSGSGDGQAVEPSEGEIILPEKIVKGKEMEFDSESSSDDDAAAVAKSWAALETRREELAERRPVDLVDFTTEIRGGRSHTGLVGDSERGRTCNAAAQNWCRKYGLPFSFTVYYSQFSDTAASALVLAWTHRMQWLYSTWQIQGSEDYAFTDEVLMEYEETVEFGEWVETQTDAKVMRRVAQIRGILPRKPLY